MNPWIALGTLCGLVGCASTGYAPSRQEAPVAATPAGCVSQTASRIPHSGCMAPGRSYSQPDIANTGQTTAAGALGLLDPGITVHH